MAKRLDHGFLPCLVCIYLGDKRQDSDMVDHLHSLMQTEARLPQISSARVSNLMAAFGADR